MIRDSKGDLICRLRDVIGRLRQVRAGSWVIGRDIGILERELDQLERELEPLIDDFMAGQLKRRYYEDLAALTAARTSYLVN
jgi:hypothetical protein